jgi:pilus assembly protein FimV
MRSRSGVDYGVVAPQVRLRLERRGENGYVIRLDPESRRGAVRRPAGRAQLAAGHWSVSTRSPRPRRLQAGLQPIAAAPPAIAAPAPEAKPVEAPKPPEVTAAAPAAPPPAPAAPAPALAEKPAAPALASEPMGTYEVKQGDTLGKIAAQYKPEGVSAQQMLVALYRANEDAFINKNMNLLRSGRVLNIPDRAAAEAVAPPDANKIVNAQFQDFNEYRTKLGRSSPPRRRRRAAAARHRTDRRPGRRRLGSGEARRATSCASRKPRRRRARRPRHRRAPTISRRVTARSPKPTRG